MADKRTREQLERRFDELCDHYLSFPHEEVIGKEIIELHKQLAEGAMLKIFLDVQSYEWLLAHISHEAPGRAALNDAHLLGNTRVVECSKAHANDLLIAANIHCPEAIVRIIDAIRIVD